MAAAADIRPMPDYLQMVNVVITDIGLHDDRSKERQEHFLAAIADLRGVLCASCHEGNPQKHLIEKNISVMDALAKTLFSEESVAEREYARACAAWNAVHGSTPGISIDSRRNPSRAYDEFMLYPSEDTARVLLAHLDSYFGMDVSGKVFESVPGYRIHLPTRMLFFEAVTKVIARHRKSNTFFDNAAAFFASTVEGVSRQYGKTHWHVSNASFTASMHK